MSSGWKEPPVAGSTLLVWDCEGVPPAGAHTTVLWSSFSASDDGTVQSIPRRIESFASAYRAKYLAWVHDLGDGLVRGAAIKDHFEIRPGFSYWWMTSFAQKFNAAERSPINNAIKLLALEDLIRTSGAASVQLVTADRRLIKAVRLLCSELRVDFTAHCTRGLLVSRRLVPAPLRAVLVFARYVFDRIGRRVEVSELAAAVTFFDVLVHLDRRALVAGSFVSNYWSRLIDWLAGAGIATNWMHWYFAHADVPSFRTASSLVRRFNQHATVRQAHHLIDSEVGPAALIGALRDYVRIAAASMQLRHARNLFRPTGSAADFWPLFSDEWANAFRGGAAIVGCVQLRSLERALLRLRRQSLGVYIQENQAWEMALIHAWKAGGHGTLVGVPHTTVRYWDLRYFHDARSYLRDSRNALPLPDLVAVNGPVATRAYCEAGYPAAKLTEVEALRYLHLLKASAHSRRQHGTTRIVLMCGDFLAATNRKLLACLRDALPLLPKNLTFRFKPHPAYPVRSSEISQLPLELVEAPLPELLAEADVVVASNITSAAVDAYHWGIPVIQVLDGASFNVSPLREAGGAVYVSTGRELAHALLSEPRVERSCTAAYFHLDESLPRWRRLVAVAEQETSQEAGRMNV